MIRIPQTLEFHAINPRLPFSLMLLYGTTWEKAHNGKTGLYSQQGLWACG